MAPTYAYILATIVLSGVDDNNHNTKMLRFDLSTEENGTFIADFEEVLQLACMEDAKERGEHVQFKHDVDIHSIIIRWDTAWDTLAARTIIQPDQRPSSPVTIGIMSQASKHSSPPAMEAEDIYILASFHMAKSPKARAKILKIRHEPDADALANMSRLRYVLTHAAGQLFPNVAHPTQITSVGILWQGIPPLIIDMPPPGTASVAPAVAGASVNSQVEVEPLEMLQLSDSDAWTQVVGIAKRGSRDVLEVAISELRP
ncbi:uncharacterized protein B0I36DRAFT_354458 [Microdochium trichocladiopsis]|uniref:Uncharacterized protein n=1 Tax=Microdochium trichocladiopsis TaxID=1682393 RepID=A0A9P9BK64_9PEZI|nr:uncharacterized protein B0I36DRAFT_354458 [Microdochium trichocladiopsis]KAH7018151.1 hypothetical protein B0I36DRAFT_354458 [Microdochium trichocladiopsis]